MENGEDVPENNEDAPEDDIFNILVATDIHLGYGERDPIRGLDSFNTFEEILQHAVREGVDFVLLGGDLFHDAKPSPFCVLRCLEILRKYTMGDKPVSFEYISDEANDYQHLAQPIVNYEDQNLNIAIPIFSIHGNHDDPIGEKQTSALDIVASTGLINYFGRWMNLREIVVNPICLKKGETNLAMFGLSHIRDERLGRLFRDKKVNMKQPKNPEEWFNLFVLHQNRAARGLKNFIPVEFLPKFLDLVVWGHEHDCRVLPECQANGVQITQPGSSVATSLSKGEALKKHIALLQVYKNSFKLKPIELTTVRPFIFDELRLEKSQINLSSFKKSQTPQEIAMADVRGHINKMIEKAAERHKDPNVPLPLPLIRLNVQYREEEQCFNVIRFGEEFTGKVANPSDLLQLKHIKKVTKTKGTCKMNVEEDEETDDTFCTIDEFASQVEDIIDKYFENQKKENGIELSILTTKGLNEAVNRLITKGDDYAVEDIINHQTEKTVKKLMEENDLDLNSLDDKISELRQRRTNQDMENELQVLDDPSRQLTGKRRNESATDAVEILSDDEECTVTNSTMGAAINRPSRGRGSRGSRRKGNVTPRATTAKGRAKNVWTNFLADDSS